VYGVVFEGVDNVDAVVGDGLAVEEVQ